MKALRMTIWLLLCVCVSEACHVLAGEQSVAKETAQANPGTKDYGQPVAKPVWLKEAAAEITGEEILRRSDLLSYTITPGNVLKVEIRGYGCRLPFDPSQPGTLVILEKTIPKKVPEDWVRIKKEMESFPKMLNPDQIRARAFELWKQKMEYEASGGKRGCNTMCWSVWVSFLAKHPEWRGKGDAAGWAFVNDDGVIIPHAIQVWHSMREKWLEYQKDPNLYILRQAGFHGITKSAPDFPPKGFQKVAEGFFMRCKAARQEWLENHPEQIRQVLLAEQEKLQVSLAGLKSQAVECQSQLTEEKIQQRAQEMISQIIGDKANSREQAQKPLVDEIKAKHPNVTREQLLRMGFVIRENDSTEDRDPVKDYFSSPENAKRITLLKESVVVEINAQLAKTSEAIGSTESRLKVVDSRLEQLKPKDAVASK